MTTIEIPGRAGARLAELGERARVSDLYDEIGAAIYHRMALADATEIRELLALVRGTDGPILDLAAGSGRITLPLLTLGRPLTALELSASMLDLLRAQADRLPGRVAELLTVVQGDMSAFSLPVRFGAIVLGITSIGLLDQPGRQGLFRCVLGHLAPGGSFLVTLVSADLDAVDIDPDFAYDIGDGAVLYSHAVPGAPVRHVTVFSEQPEQDVVHVCTSQIRQITVAQLTAELDAAGLAIANTVRLASGGMPGYVHHVFQVRPTTATARHSLSAATITTSGHADIVGFAKDATYVGIRLPPNGSPAPGVPGTTVADASARSAGAEFATGAVSYHSDPTCNNIELVTSQTPRPMWALQNLTGQPGEDG